MKAPAKSGLTKVQQHQKLVDTKGVSLVKLATPFLFSKILIF